MSSASHRRPLDHLATALFALGGLLLGYAFVANAFGFDPLPGLGKGRVRDATALAAAGVTALGLGALVGPHVRGRMLGWLAAAEPVTPVRCVGLAVWFGLVVGLVEVGHQAVRKFALGVLLGQPLEFVWMAPLSYVVILLALSLVLGAAAGLMPRRVTLPVVVFAFAGVGAVSQCLFYPWHRVSMAILALGIAVQAARAAAAHPARVSWLVRRTTPVLLLVVVGAGLAIPVGRAAGENRFMADLLEPAPDVPNVLLLVLDTVRADHLGLHGYPRATSPRIDGLASQSGAVAFDHAWSTSPWTLPSHASMFTGKYPFELSADWLSPLDHSDPTLAEVLAGHGYATGGFVGNLAYCLKEHGLARGFARYEDYAVTPAVIGFSTAVGNRLLVRSGGNSFNELIRNGADHVTDRALAWIESLEDERPFFAFLNYYDAHTYYIAPEPYDSMFGPPSPHIRDWYSGREWTDAEKQGFIDAYDGCIAFLDAQIGRLLDRLAETGRLDDTVIVVTSDHGELFWEHGLTDHGNSLYRPLLHAPLIVRDPRRGGEPTRVPDRVTLRDLPATVLGLVGLDPALLPGHSLTSYWAGEKVPSPSPLRASLSKGIGTSDTPHSKGDMESVVRDGWHTIRNGDGTEEVYDVVDDPLEQRNLSGK